MTLRAGLRSLMRRLAERHRWLEPPVNAVWNTYEHVRFTVAAHRNGVRHRNDPAPVAPSQLLYVNPNLVERHSPGSFDFISKAGAVVGGQWDTKESPRIEDQSRYKSFREHFFDGVPWEETDFYREKTEKIKSDRSAKYESVTAFDETCRDLDELYRELLDEGYRTQRQLAVEGRTGNPGDGGPPPIIGVPDSIVRHEVSVDVARNGELLLNEGRHRLCLAKLIGLKEIPVRIVVRHRRWQDLRNAIATECRRRAVEGRAELESALYHRFADRLERTVRGIAHPDIRVLLPSD